MRPFEGDENSFAKNGELLSLKGNGSSTEAQAESPITMESNENSPEETPNETRSERQSELQMPFELAKIQLQLAEIELDNRLAGRTTPASTTATEPGASEAFKAYVQREYDLKTEVGRYIQAFYEKVKAIRKPTSLIGMQTYPTWRENILLAAKQADVDGSRKGYSAIRSPIYLKPFTKFREEIEIIGARLNGRI